MTETGIEIRQLVPDDEKSLPDFFARAYGPENVRYRYPERWRWLHLENPFIPPQFGLPAWIALCDGEIVGYIGGMFVPCQIAGSKRIAIWGVDLVVLAQHRGKGIGALLMKAVMDADELFLALAMEPQSRHLILKHGGAEGPSAELYKYTNRVKTGTLFGTVRWRLEHRLGRFAYRVVWGAIAASGAPWLFAKGCELRLKTLQNRKKLPRRPMTADIRRVVRFGREADELWESSGQRYDFAVVRGEKYLNWKYVDQPGTQYECFYAYLGDVLSGLVVFRKGRSPEPPIDIIADVLWANGHDALITDLLQFALDYLNREDPIGVYCATSDPVVIERLNQLGFLHASSSALCTYYRAGETTRLREKGQVLLSMGDHDWDQYPWTRHLSISEIRRIVRSG